MDITKTNEEIVFDIERQYPEVTTLDANKETDYQGPNFPVLEPAVKGERTSIFHDFTHKQHVKGDLVTPNVIVNSNIKTRDFLSGDQAVDYLHYIYTTYPEAFNGSSERAFKNRESVFTLTLNLLTEDYYSYYKDKHVKLYALNLFQDILNNIGLGRTPDDKPRYSLALHKELINDYVNQLYVSEYENYNASNSIHGPNINVELKGTINNNLLYKKFSDVVFGDVNPYNTRIFIIKVLEKGGIGLLINYLKVMFGTYYYYSKAFN